MVVAATVVVVVAAAVVAVVAVVARAVKESRWAKNYQILNEMIFLEHR